MQWSSFLLVTLAVVFLLKISLGKESLLRSLLPLDTPNERSSHHTSIPRGGGLAILLAITVVLPWIVGGFGWKLWGITLGLALISYWDDWRSIPILVRLGGHLLAAFLLLYVCLDFAWSLSALLLMIGMVWMINLYNFMDGSDGLAAGMAVIGFGTYALAAGLTGNRELTFLSLAIAAASLGFLKFNFPPARIFLGDVGSIPLGFLSGAVGLVGWRQGSWSLIFPVLVFSPFIMDATFTLLKRIVRRELFWRAHRQHNYQLIIRQGVGHRGTAFIYYGLMILSAALALFSQRYLPVDQGIMLGAFSIIYVIFFMITHRYGYRFNRKVS